MRVDAGRAGGEPSVIALPTGELLYATHAQFTHYLVGRGVDPSVVTPFRGQAYLWRSGDRGASWQQATLPPYGVGFGDPDFTLDAAGNVYFAAMSLAQTTVAQSKDRGRTWTANPTVMEVADREWIAGGAANEVFMSVRLGAAATPGIFRSADGGLTWTLQGLDDVGEYPINKLWFDAQRRVLYHSYTTGAFGGESHEVGVSVSTDLGKTWTHRKAASIGYWLGVAAPPMTVDRSGRIHLAYATTGNDGHTHLRLVSSSDRGVTWSKPVAIADTGAAVFPWLTAGTAGRVGAAWYCADRGVPDVETQVANWSVCAATVIGGRVQRTRVTPNVVHAGTICIRGLTCETEGIDRRLGDFLTVAMDNDGSLLVAYAETRSQPQSAVSRPAFVRQVSGPRLR